MSSNIDPAFQAHIQHDVAIVGFGPAGAVLANLLAIKGLSVLVLDREADVYRLPRAIHFDGECMRVFQTLGISDELMAQLFVSPGMKFVNAEGKVLIDYTRSVELGGQAWHPGYRFHQPDFEDVLRKKLEQYPQVEVRLRHDVFAITEHEDGVELRVEDTSCGRLLKVHARYVVGCDGARSTVRRMMGTELDDLNSHERWLVVDVLLQRERSDLGDHSIQYCDPRRPATYVRGVGERRRWEFMLMPVDDPTTITRPESVWSLLAPWVTPADAVLERPAVYTFHSVVAKGWRNGRLLIAGDAAHQTPPFMGQGMCAGVRDVYNLAWKLADVVQGHASETLLDTYESERSPHVREFIETAVRFGKVIQATDHEVVKKRDASMLANTEVFHTPQPALGSGAHEGGRIAGTVSVQPVLKDGTRLDDVVGYRFVLVANPDICSDLNVTPDERVAVIPAHDPSLKNWLESLSAQAVLVRPDRYIAGAASDVGKVQDLIQVFVGSAVL
ncbi:MAG: bifunctional 3-(3-hydroxy-phenyl)propionate/3-hydroxycinnamic acid hydroxylase [Hydrogenophaga sp.]|nr:bifunctional 3-(3-hydroxy-phenyl)propionate/3-hydroxycinnamic acid hydroxylase [Hydrogenophaga sp.]